MGADLLHDEGIDGYGVTVAVLDTGYWNYWRLDMDPSYRYRLRALYDAIVDQEARPPKAS